MNDVCIYCGMPLDRGPFKDSHAPGCGRTRREFMIESTFLDALIKLELRDPFDFDFLKRLPARTFYPLWTREDFMLWMNDLVCGSIREVFGDDALDKTI